VRIYQLLPGSSHVNETRRTNGTLAENGCGRFSDLDDTALAALRAMGFTHLWLTGVLRQATATDYAEIGLYADDPDLLKGQAGSPYAIKDYFDVCPDYADDPAGRARGVRRLDQRVHTHQLRVIIDFVANHVARCYRSLVRADLDFGAPDDGAASSIREQLLLSSRKIPPAAGPPLKLPTYANGQANQPDVFVLALDAGNFVRQYNDAPNNGNRSNHPDTVSRRAAFGCKYAS